MPPVEVVLINWKRPHNLTAIVDALRSQSVPCTLTLCDCHPSPEFALDPETLARFDRVYRWGHNLGAYSRYVPLSAFDHPYTYFADDDMLPGTRCLEHFLDHATGQEFGVLGQNGRRLRADGVYRTERVRRTRSLEEVDLTIRAYFVETKHLSHVAALRWEMGLQNEAHLEDDLLLAVAMQLRAGRGCYLTPHSDDPETSTMKAQLPSPFSLSERKDHLDRRTAFLRQATGLGWRSLAHRQPPPLARRIFGRV